MGRTVGFTFSVGARLQSSVASAFDTVAGRASRLKRDMKDLRAVSGTAGKLTSAKATVDSLRAEAAAGKDHPHEPVAFGGDLIGARPEAAPLVHERGGLLRPERANGGLAVGGQHAGDTLGEAAHIASPTCHWRQKAQR